MARKTTRPRPTRRKAKKARSGLLLPSAAEKLDAIGGHGLAAVVLENAWRTESFCRENGLTEPGTILPELAAELGGTSERGMGTLLLDAPSVRRALSMSWRRAWEGAKEDVALMEKLGRALRSLKDRRRSDGISKWERVEADRLKRVDGLLPRDEAEARRFEERVYVERLADEAGCAGRREEANDLTWLSQHPEAVGLLLGARAKPPARGPLPYRRLARALVRPFSSRDPETVDRDIASERRARERQR